MDFTQTFQANSKCININHDWSQFYRILVVLKYHRLPWANIFDTEISRCIYCSGIFGLLWDIYNPTNVCVKDVDSWASMVFRNYQNFIELTSNMIYCVALGIGLKLGQWTPGPKSSDRPEAGLILLGLHSLEWAFHWVSLSILLGPLKTGFPGLGQALYFFLRVWQDFVEFAN